MFESLRSELNIFYFGKFLTPGFLNGNCAEMFSKMNYLDFFGKF